MLQLQRIRSTTARIVSQTPRNLKNSLLPQKSYFINVVMKDHN